MDNTDLTSEVAHLFRLNGYKVDVSVTINHREIDIRAEEMQGFIRKILLVECADHSSPVGVSKLQEDMMKLNAAREKLQENATLVHVSRNGYTQNASGWALDKGISIYSITSLMNQLVNFDPYIKAIENDRSREIILNEYQPTKIHFDEKPINQATPAMDFISEWICKPSRWLTILGDYGVGKSWMLKRFLYLGIEKHKNNPSTFPLPFFVPLQRFTKAFDYQNLILRTFQLHGLAGVSYAAFDYLAKSGRILFLFDSFDEMAQYLHRDTIRENLKELLVGMSGQSKAIMTSRPTYFENRAERLVAVESNGVLIWHPLDRTLQERRVLLSRFLSESFGNSQFARLMDLSSSQRKKLFAIVLGSRTKAYNILNGLLDRFSELGSISQRAVIARLLTTVAETLASGQSVVTIEGYPLIPDDLQVLNQGKIFEIVIHNLLYRDQQIGDLSASDRYYFLRIFAIFLQQTQQQPFATPEEIRAIIEKIFDYHLRRSDAREQLLEQYYRTCRRHSGLTTENQFQDTTGQLDLPVEENDVISRVGFSHNSLREYLVASAFADYLLNCTQFAKLNTVVVTEAVTIFFADLVIYSDQLPEKLSTAFRNCSDSNLRERLFKLLFHLISIDPNKYIRYLGKPPMLNDLDLTGVDLSGLPLSDTNFAGSILPETDCRDTDLRRASFIGSILSGTMLDDSNIQSTDFSKAEIESIFVFDEFDTKTSAMLVGKDARQWLFSHGAIVRNPAELNPLLGRPWYEAAREVTKTLVTRIAGTHRDSSLPKGTALEHRRFAKNFVKYLRNSGVLMDIKRSDDKSAMIVKVKPEYREIIMQFNDNGIIDDILQPFFDKHTPT